MANGEPKVDAVAAPVIPEPLEQDLDNGQELQQSPEKKGHPAPRLNARQRRRDKKALVVHNCDNGKMNSSHLKTKESHFGVSWSKGER